MARLAWAEVLVELEVVPQAREVAIEDVNEPELLESIQRTQSTMQVPALSKCHRAGSWHGSQRPGFSKSPPHARSGMMDAGLGTWVFPVLELIKAGASHGGNGRAA